MKAALVCPGPSIARYAGTFDRVVCVNRAALKVACDTWACGDYPLVVSAGPDVLGTPTLYTAGTSAEWLALHGHPWRGDTLTFDSLYDGTEHAYLWPMFSATAALFLLGRQGVRAVTTFGVDWDGQQDFDGTPGGNRSEDRWALERNIFRNVAGLFGMTVARG